MIRDEIKHIVYNCLINQYYNDDIRIKLMSKPNDGEDELLYDELKFDSLDMIEFMISVEKEIGNGFIFEDDLIDSQITLRKVIDYINIKVNGK